MRKIVMIWMTLCLSVVTLACGGNDPEVDGTTDATEQPGDNGSGSATSGKRSLVIYFSRAGENWQVGNVERGNTAIMVDYIKELANVDVFEIVPETPYPDNYTECVRYVNDVEIPQNLRPAYKGDIENLADYDNIFIGGPIWYGQPPMIIRTFIEAHQKELSGKIFIPFGTHGGSGIGSYSSLIRSYFPGAKLLESLGIAGSDIRSNASKSKVENWLKRIGLDKESTNTNYDNDMNKAREEIQQYLSEWCKAMVDADTVKLGSMLADDIILRHITGQTQTKQEWLDEVASGSMDYHKIEQRDVNIKFINSETADVSFTSVITATIWGSNGTWTLHNTMRLARINGHWIRVKDDYTSGINQISSTPSADQPEYTLGGLLTKGGKGVIIKNKKKYIRK